MLCIFRLYFSNFLAFFFDISSSKNLLICDRLLNILNTNTKIAARYISTFKLSPIIVNEIAISALTKKPDTNMGKMFFIYSGNLIPMSSFILAAISALGGDKLVIKGSYKDIVTYGKTYSFEDIK